MKKFSRVLVTAMAAMCMFGSMSAVAEEKTVVTYWTNDRHDIDYVNKMIDKFNAENTDNIEIQMQTITDEYENQILLAYQGGTAPDIIGQTKPTYIKSFVDNGMVLSLTDLIKGDETFQKVNDPFNNAFEGFNAFGDDIYWVPSGMRSGVRIEYNKALLEKCGYTEVPTTVDEYIEMAKAITEAGNGEYYGIGFTSASPFERQLEMMAQVSGIYYYDYVNGKFDFSGYKPILEKGRELLAAAYPDQQGVDNMRALFQNGSFALWGNASQEAGVFTKQLPITDFEWGVAPVPSLDGEVKGALETLPNKGYLIMSSCENVDAAWKVIQFFQSEEFIKGYLENGYLLPITEYMDNLIDKSKIGRLADFSLLPYESVYPAVPNVTLTGDDYRTVLWNAVMGYVDIDEAIEDLNTRYNQAYEDDILSGNLQRLVISDFDPLHPSAGTATYLDK